MASKHSNSSRPLLVLHDKEEGHLVYDLLLVLGSDREEDPDQAQTLSISCLLLHHDPVACFPSRLGCRAFAVSGSSILGAFYDFWDDTLFHDTVMLAGGYYDFWERQPSPRRVRDSEGRLVQWWPMGRAFDVSFETDGYNAAPAMLPIGDGTVIRMDTLLFDGIYSFETLVPGDGGGWHATALPKPPVGQLEEDEIVFVSAYLAVGTRVWISVTRKGTFSLDTRQTAGAWTAEGAWQLPFHGRALHVPELDAVIGLAADDAEGARILCACDVVRTGTGTPPVTRHLWRETLPWPWEERIASDGRRHSPESRPRDMPSLAYLGKGTFCICRPMSAEEHRWPPVTYDACAFLVVEVARLPGGELQLAKRGRMSYMCPPPGREWAYLGFIQPAT